MPVTSMGPPLTPLPSVLWLQLAVAECQGSVLSWGPLRRVGSSQAVWSQVVPPPHMFKHSF